MRKRAALATSAAALAALALVVLIFTVVRQRVRRHPVFPTVSRGEQKEAPRGIPPVERWSASFEALQSRGEWDEIDDLLDAIEKAHPDLYRQWSLAYLHARARLETNDLSGAEEKLRAYLAAGNPLRDLALFHEAEIAEERDDEAGASRARRELIFGYPDGLYRDEAIEDEIAHLAGLKDPQPLIAFASKLYGSSSTARRRDLDAHVAQALAASGNTAAALDKAISVLKGGTNDDASDTAARAIDLPELTNGMTAAQLELLGTTMQNHRHFDRSVALLSAALRGLPQKRGDILFAIGRSYFGDEKFAEAEQAYMRGANESRDPKDKAMFLFHASRAAQLTGDDPGAERLMTAAAAIPGNSPATSAALTQRMRTRLKQRRLAEATADLQRIRKIAGKSHDLVDASVAYSIAMVGRGNINGALATLNSVPPALLNEYDRPEFDYWRGRALESRDAHAAFMAYLNVLRSRVPTHFAYFARDRVNSPAMAPKLAQEVAARDREVDGLIAAKKLVEAKQAATDRILLSTADRPRQLNRLAAIYSELPEYRAVLSLEPQKFPTFPLRGEGAGSAGVAPAAAGRAAPGGSLNSPSEFIEASAASLKSAKKRPAKRVAAKPARGAKKKAAPAPKKQAPAPPPRPAAPAFDRGPLLMAMGLYDEAVDSATTRWNLHPMAEALTQSLALNRGGASKPSIFAVEVLMKSVPDDYVPDLLPLAVRQLLYPRYFYDFIVSDSKKYGADPTLVLSIMREESRFNPRAKSAAAARGLLQFIITTARDIGHEVGLVDVSPDDLYDPRIIIRLGAKYIATLLAEFNGNHYAAAAAYNAGPQQVALWFRLAPGSGDDYFLSSINFDETKDYVRKVMNSYRRYSEIYANTGPAGGLRVEP